MKLREIPVNALRPLHRRLGEGAFTMVEVAMSLAIVAFALVAIMGVLPTGLNVQRQNREETIISQDGTYLLEAIRQGALGTNLTILSSNLVLFELESRHDPGQTVAATNRWTRMTPIELMLQISRPRQIPTYGNGTLTNKVRMRFRAFSGNMTSLMSTGTNDAFQYEVTTDIMPITPTVETGTNIPVAARIASGNLYSVKLTYRWPVLPNGSLGLGEKVFTTQINGQLRPMLYMGDVNLANGTYQGILTNFSVQYDMIAPQNNEPNRTNATMYGYLFERSFAL